MTWKCVTELIVPINMDLLRKDTRPFDTPSSTPSIISVVLSGGMIDVMLCVLLRYNLQISGNSDNQEWEKV